MASTEIAASLYPWDLADEGVDRCLENLQREAACNSVYLVGLMHHEKRPMKQHFYPHNPVRRYYYPEDSRIYWDPDPECYAETEIEPLTSERSFLRDTDWLQLLVDEARSCGMKTGCEISHTILDSAVAKNRYTDLLQEDVHGETITVDLAGHERVRPCVNKQDVREYVCALVEDLAKNYDIDYVQTCLLFFRAGFHWGRESRERRRLLDSASGGCFCDACRERAERAGYDWERMVADTQRLSELGRTIDLPRAHELQLLEDSNETATSILLEHPGFVDWLRFRTESVTELFRVIKERVSQFDVEFRYNTHLDFPELEGHVFSPTFEHVDSVRECEYSEQAGTREAMHQKRERLMRVRRAMREKPLLAGIGVRPDATPELIRAGVNVAFECGADGLSIGHYDGATMERLRAVREGLRQAEIDVEGVVDAE